METTLDKIQFPIYPLRQYDGIEYENNRTFITTHYDTYLLDDLNIDEPTYARRRVALRRNNVTNYKLYSIKFTIFDMRSLLEYLVYYRNKFNFIDNHGTVLKLKKTKFYIVTTYKIEKVSAIEGEGYVYKIKTLPMPFKLQKFSSEQYMEILEYNNGYYPIGFCEENKRPYKVKL